MQGAHLARHKGRGQQCRNMINHGTILNAATVRLHLRLIRVYVTLPTPLPVAMSRGVRRYLTDDSDQIVS